MVEEPDAPSAQPNSPSPSASSSGQEGSEEPLSVIPSERRTAERQKSVVENPTVEESSSSAREHSAKESHAEVQPLRRSLRSNKGVPSTCYRAALTAFSMTALDGRDEDVTLMELDSAEDRVADPERRWDILKMPVPAALKS
ncbi:hypothetical protein CLOM_g20259 [Closterium sp. NIES-68]|nr:hypothetical protein CLOM_g20259 [Closterium sp. NIES-68]